MSLLEPVRKIGQEAGRAILEIYATDFAVKLKADASPMTAADEAADRVIVPALAALAPEIPIVSEERSAGHPYATGLSRFWLVDPLDGTREFLNRNGEFTVNIALIEDGQPVLGVVHVPVTGVTYAACGPGTATRQDATAMPQSIAARAAPGRGAVVVHSRSHSDEIAIATFMADLESPSRRISGSSVKFCLVAEGEADFYPRFGTTMEWDTAAGHAVLAGAGGEVVTLGGARLSYGKTDFRNPHFVATGLSSDGGP